jgi:pimeloyl-ACP methyl ester carboxylesterase
MAASELTHQNLTVEGGLLHMVEAGHEHPDTLVLLHGWPEDWTEWRQIMDQACKTHHVIAFDLPGVGESHGTARGGEKATIADTIHQVVQALKLSQYTIVGHDAGAMVAYAYLRKFSAEIKAAVLISSVIPGVEPWSKVLANPHIWHFAFHSTLTLPETLIMGHQRVYFDHFFDILTVDHSAIDDTARNYHASAYQSPEALQAGFDWYRAFSKDAETNSQNKTKIDVPLLYLRGEFEGGNMDEYVHGFHDVGFELITTSRIPGSGHFTPEENPEAVWMEIVKFVELHKA